MDIYNNAFHDNETLRQQRNLTKAQRKTNNDTKEGVLAELTEFMFENQFGVAEKIIGTGKNPVLLYAVETCIQLTLTEMNEHLRDIYMEAYTQPSLMDYIH